MSPETQALVALRSWAHAKPGVVRIVPRVLARCEMGPFGRYRGGDGGPSPSEHLMGLAEGVSETLSPVSAINRPRDGDCVILRKCTSWEIPAPLPRWERPGRAAVREAVRSLLAETGTVEDIAVLLDRAVISSQRAACVILGACETCGEIPGPGQEEPIHQPWCPEVGGWWCNACQSWSGAGVRCSTCYRHKSEAQDWSPYSNCPACDARLPEDTQGELASCACGWKEGE